MKIRIRKSTLFACFAALFTVVKILEPEQEHHQMSQFELLAKQLNKYDASECQNHTQTILQAVAAKEVWALQMVDSIGRQPSALLYDGNLRWLGSWEECMAVEPVVYTDPVNRIGPHRPFKPIYCTTDFTFYQAPFTPPEGVIASVGMCLPISCDSDGLKALADKLVTYMQLPEGILKARSVNCKDSSDRQLTDNAKTVICVCLLFMVVIAMATAYDYYIVLVLNDTKLKSRVPNSFFEKVFVDLTDKTKIFSNALSGYFFTANEKAPILPAGDQNEQPVIDTKSLPSYSLSANGKVMQRDIDQSTAMSHHAVDVKLVGEEPAWVPEGDCQYKPGKLGQLLLSFSVYTNGAKILDTKQTAGSLTALHGIRFLSMIWVILNHTVPFGVNAPDNYNSFVSHGMPRMRYQIIPNGTVCVDSFFVLSGTLVAYLSFKEMTRIGGPRKFGWFLYYFHRFWRVTIPYMLVMMVYVPLFGYWGEGPLWVPDAIEKECSDSWWHNLLYINNLIDYSKSLPCMVWGWYLANDMQFFIISPLMLVPLFYSKILGGVVCFLMISVSIVSSAIISWTYKFYSVEKIITVDPDQTAPAGAVWSGSALLGVGYIGPNPHPEVNRHEVLYNKPYTRIGPYVLGVLVGYILFKTNCRVNMRKRWNVLGWAAAATTGYLIVFGPFTEDGMYHMTDYEATLYNATYHVGWGLALSWVIFACATGYGGPVNTLLSWPVMIPLSRLCYCAYLVHPIVLQKFYNSVPVLQHWYDLDYVYRVIGNVTLSMAGAFVVSLAFEAPMMGLEKVLLGKGKSKN